MDRFPNLELAEEPSWKPNYIIRSLQGLVVRPRPSGVLQPIPTRR
jgi:hypothetical protein